MNPTVFDNNLCSGSITTVNKDKISVNGVIKSLNDNPKILYWASNPPTNGGSFSGSGLPYPNPEVAYENTPNSGSLIAVNKRFSFELEMPNAYYIGLGSLYVPPHFHIKVFDTDSSSRYTTVKINDGIPFRTLTHPAPPTQHPRNGAMFYHTPEQEIRSQEQILRDNAYPSEYKMPDNFWGSKPPM